MSWAGELLHAHVAAGASAPTRTLAQARRAAASTRAAITSAARSR